MPAAELSSLAGLIDFEAAARHGGFRAAAAELHKTPAALSQQIRQLEQALGLALFVRHPRHVAITPAGRELAQTVAASLAQLRAKVAALRLAQDPHRLHISTTHSLAIKWLVPRLHVFSERHPALDIRVDADDGLADLDGGGCDLALRYQALDTADDFIYAEQLVLVHSPALAAARTPLPALLRHALLHEGDTQAWQRLIDAQGLSARHADFSRVFSHSGLLVQAAVAGQGIALAPYALAHEDLRRGRLLRAAAPALPSGHGYRLLWSAARLDAAPLQAFADWLAGEFAQLRASLGAAPATPAKPARTRAR
ncbi:LysR substrate-binding domain-containing protein [Paucibacter soli]|uniref:LysR substrate-binding domain-containing protein n=1 Tax=Paucibacter soli TaxID=3133433 RepID=UPI0030B6C9BF